MKLALVMFAGAALSLPLLAQNGYLVARGGPGNAGLFVDGKYIGPASRFTVPEKYEVAAGEREVSLRDPRYEDYTTKVTINAKKKTKIKYKLNKLPEPTGPFGRLRFGGDGPDSFMSVTSGDTGAIFLNNKYYGYIDELNNAGGGLLLPTGTYKLKVTDSKFDMERDVTIEADKVTLVPLGAK